LMCTYHIKSSLYFPSGAGFPFLKAFRPGIMSAYELCVCSISKVLTRPEKSLHIYTKNPTTSLHINFHPEIGLHYYFTFVFPNKAEVSNAEEQLTRNYFGG